MVNKTTNTNDVLIKHFVISFGDKKLILCHNPVNHNLVISSPSQGKARKHTEIIVGFACKPQNISKIPKNKNYIWTIKQSSSSYGLKFIGRLITSDFDENQKQFISIEIIDKRKESTGMICKVYTEPENLLFADFKKV